MCETIFGGFWPWLGAVILLGVACSGVAQIILAVRGINTEG